MINEERRKLQLEALHALRENSFRGIVILPTGTGKSFVLIEALKELYKPGMSVLYTCDSIRLRDSDFNKELEKWGRYTNDGLIDFTQVIEKQCYASAYKMIGNHYNILLADEGDYGLTPAYSRLFSENTFDYIIFVSATLESKKRAIAKDIAPIVYERKLKEIEENKVVNKSQFYYVPYYLNAKENAQYLEYNKRFHHLLQENGPHVAQRLKFLTFDRLHFLAGLESSAYICRRLMLDLKYHNNKSKMLIFCGMTEQADRICKHSYHTKNQEDGNLDKFNNNEIQECAVCGKIDRGINLDGVNTVIMENVTASETKMIQKLGRGKRLDVDDLLNVYFLIPYYKQLKMNRMQPYPTVVLNKVQKACRNMGIENAKTYILKLDNG